MRAEQGAAAFVRRAAGPVLLATGAAGLAAAFALTVERFKLLEDPTYTPVCSFDAVISCASVMTSDQAEAFGFPNPLLGIAGFAALLAFGVVLTTGGALPRPAWWALQAGLAFAVGFVHWLFFQSTYRIEAICPFCVAVWIATIVAFVYVTLANVPRLAPLARYHSLVAIAWLGVLGVLLGIAFRDHWATLL